MKPTCLWQTVNPEEKPFLYQGQVVATGEEFDDTWKHIGTGFASNGLVWHLLIKPR